VVGFWCLPLPSRRVKRRQSQALLFYHRDWMTGNRHKLKQRKLQFGISKVRVRLVKQDTFFREVQS